MNDATFGEMPCPISVSSPSFESVPGNVVLDVGLLAQLLGAHVVSEWAHGLAFAEDFQGDALEQIAETAAVGKEPRLPRHHVDETRRNDLTVNIDVAAPAIRGNITDFGDRVAADGDTSGGTR